MAGNALHITEQHPVLLRNKHINGYLVRGSSYDKERYHVSVASDIITNPQLNIEGGLSYIGGLSVSSQVPLGYSYEAAKWNLVKHNNGEYEIIHSAFNEPLYAASNGFAYDKDRRKVFTWRPGPSVTQGFWRFEDAGNGYYKIRNTQHGEYLYAAEFPKKGWVFTWRPVVNYDNDDAKFYWQLVKA